MNLRRFIDHYYGGNREAFRAAVGVSAKTVYRWLNMNAVAHHGAVCFPVRDLPPVPAIAPDERREHFEAILIKGEPSANIERIGDTYISSVTQAMWTGWRLAQAKATEEALF
ncbi:hypothetical protein POJ32_004214 [Salmonella enterica]|nr:hypothetical protein [Salmonella enterica]